MNFIQIFIPTQKKKLQPIKPYKSYSYSKKKKKLYKSLCAPTSLLEISHFHLSINLHKQINKS
jgi:hypothetical protein